VKLHLEDLLGAEVDGEGDADVANLRVLAGPLTPTFPPWSCLWGAHEYGERERKRSRTSMEHMGAHEWTSMELASCLPRTERSLLESMKIDKEGENHKSYDVHARA
jgi:hypothetical protein